MYPSFFKKKNAVFLRMWLHLFYHCIVNVNYTCRRVLHVIVPEYSGRLFAEKLNLIQQNESGISDNIKDTDFIAKRLADFKHLEICH